MKNTVDKLLKKLRKHIGTGGCLLLILYTAFVLFTQSFTRYEFPKAYYLVYLLLCLLVSVLVCPYIIRFLSGLGFHGGKTETKMSKARALLHDAALFAAIFAVFLVNYISYYPGAFSPDCVNQYEQALNNTYSDWHPALHTLLAFKLPMLLTGNWPGSMVLLQIICFSAALAYSFRTVSEYTNKKYAVLGLLFVLLNPQTGSIAMFPWKDISFAICALLMMTYALRIYATKGEWIKAPLNAAAFVTLTAVTTIIRHNAVLFTLPLLFAVMFFVERKRFLIICGCAALLFAGIKYPLYSALDVEQPDNRQVEKLGLPMTVIGAAVTYTPERMDEETLEFAYKVAPRETWEEDYISGSYNLVKEDEHTDNNVIEEYGSSSVISIMLKCFKNSPVISLAALVDLTDQVYSLSVRHGDFIGPTITPDANKYGIYPQGNQIIRGFCTVYRNFISEYLGYPFLRLGLLHFILIASVLSVLSLKKFKDWKRIFFILPVFLYNFGTTLLLTGFNDAARFFYYTFALMPVLLVFIFKKDQRACCSE